MAHSNLSRGMHWWRQVLGCGCCCPSCGTSVFQHFLTIKWNKWKQNINSGDGVIYIYIIYIYIYIYNITTKPTLVHLREKEIEREWETKTERKKASERERESHLAIPYFFRVVWWLRILTRPRLGWLQVSRSTTAGCCYHTYHWSLFTIRPWTTCLLILLLGRCQHPLGLKRFLLLIYITN